MSYRVSVLREIRYIMKLHGSCYVVLVGVFCWWPCSPASQPQRDAAPSTRVRSFCAGADVCGFPTDAIGEVHHRITSAILQKREGRDGAGFTR